MQQLATGMAIPHLEVPCPVPVPALVFIREVPVPVPDRYFDTGPQRNREWNRYRAAVHRAKHFEQLIRVSNMKGTGGGAEVNSNTTKYY